MYDHPFHPSEQDPDRCGLQLPSTARWPAPPTEACWGLEESHPSADEVARLRTDQDTP